ncbi:MAG TPA: DUF4148 domain-containing protein [Burkholderiaceae bacterium]|nr:DUF4148 domain-containing protein [Burkholderiaceae bacterium]
MKSIALSLSALLVTTALPAVAGEIVPFDDHFVSTRTRAEVMSEVAAAAAAGHLYTQGEIITYPGDPAPRSMLTRAQVKAELARAQAAGELSTQNEISWEPPMMARTHRQQFARGEHGR